MYVQIRFSINIVDNHKYDIIRIITSGKNANESHNSKKVLISKFDAVQSSLLSHHTFVLKRKRPELDVM